jgi:hypothetical protein
MGLLGFFPHFGSASKYGDPAAVAALLPAAKGRRKEKNSRKGRARVRAFFVDGWVTDIISGHTKIYSRKRLAMGRV